LLDTTEDKFALFFERSNSKGVRLSFVDILTAKLYKGFKLRDETREFNSNNNPIDLKLQVIVRYIAFLVSKGKSIKQSFILKELDAEHFEQNWENVTNLYKKTHDWLFENKYFISQQWMTYENMLIPLMHFLNNIPGKDFSQISERQNTFIKFWYWSSIFSQRYSAASNETIIRDSKILRDIALSGKCYDRSLFSELKYYINEGEDIINLVSKRSVLYTGTLNFMNQANGGYTNWNNDNLLSLNSKIEDHHIFPVQYLKDKYSSENSLFEYIDSVANRTLIPKLTNIKIGKKKPSEYFQKLHKKNLKLIETLKKHNIPNPEDIINGKYDERFEDFLLERAIIIFNKIEAELINKFENIKTEFLDTKNTPTNNS